MLYKFPMLKYIVICAFAVLAFLSCVNTKRVTNFNNIQNASFTDQQIEPVVQRNDILSIIVTSLNSEATEVFNKPNESVISSSSGNGVSSITTGYLVDQQGNITFPIIGKLRAEGLTHKQLADTLTSTLIARKLLVDPIVNIRLINFKVSVLGEVNRPSVVFATNGQLSFLEALGMAGDLTMFSERDKILLIRVENGQRITRRINLTSPDFVASSPYYYLKSNDIIYVETNRNKIGSTTALRQTLPAILSGLSFLAIIIDRLTR